MLDAVISFFAAILAGMGVGSGGIMVIWFALAVGLPQLESQLLNLVFFVASSLAALGVNLVKRRISLWVVLPMSLGGCVFSVGASIIAREIGSAALRKLFGVLMILMSVITIVFSLQSTKNNDKEKNI